MSVENRTLAWALALIKAGIWVFPCKHHAKTPATTHGFHDATLDETQVRGWFGHNGDLNLAIRCGPQPGVELNLVVLDIDPDKGGDVSWAAWEADHVVPPTVRHETPSGGFHLFFNAPKEFRPSADQFAPGIDVRASDSYVVGPPSMAPSKVTGELLPYKGHRELPLTDPPSVALMPVDMTEHLVSISGNGHVDGRVVVSGMPPKAADGDSVADLARVGWVWHNELPVDGWVFDRQRPNGDSEWVRPGKDPRHGSSATLHNNGDGPLVTWSTSLPVGGKAGRGAAIASFSPWDYIVTFRCDGDTSAAARLVRGLGPARGPGRSVDEPPPQVTALVIPELDPDAWDRLSQLGHIRRAGWAELVAPGGLLVEALCRTSALIPPCYKLPGFSGAQVGVATLDMMGCVVAETGVGKSLTTKVGRSLIPDPEALMPFESRVRLMDQNPGSGEGLIDAFYTTEREENAEGDMVEVRRVRRQAVYLACDEGDAFVEVSKRKGVTVVQTMNSAWSGETLGNLNTGSGGRMRHIAPQQVRFSAVINMQASNAWKLFDEKMTTIGFAGRLLFGLAVDPNATGEVIAWPGPLTFPTWLHYAKTEIFGYDPRIFIEIRERRLTALRGEINDAKRSQHLVMQCKIAAILAFWRDSHDVTIDDWALAGTILDYSSRVLEYLELLTQQSQRDADHRADLRRAKTATTVNAALHEDAVVRLKGRVVTAIRRHRVRTRRQIKDLSDAPRDALWLAVDELLAEGLIVLRGEGYEMAP